MPGRTAKTLATLPSSETLYAMEERTPGLAILRKDQSPISIAIEIDNAIQNVLGLSSHL